MNSSRSTARYVFGGILVAFGALLLLSNTDVINLDWLWNFVKTWWPMLVIVWGLWELVSGGLRFRFWPIILLLLGIGFQLSALELWEWDFKVVWPVFIVIVGLAFLLGRRNRRLERQRQDGAIVEGSIAASTVHGESWRAVFNSIEDRYVGEDFRGGEVESNFGNVALDLREAGLAGGSATLNIQLSFGGLHLRVPPGWRVNVGQVATSFGHVQDNRAKPEPEDADGELHITGTIAFGNLEIND